MTKIETLAAAKAVVVKAEGHLRPEAAELTASRLLTAYGLPCYGRAHCEAVLLGVAAEIQKSASYGITLDQAIVRSLLFSYATQRPSLDVDRLQEELRQAAMRKAA
jgi:hypothetical protein